MSRTISYHLFSLPPELLVSLTPRNLLSQGRPPSPTPPDQVSEIVQSTASGSRSCGVCLGVVFKDVENQRSHFRSDWHRYNVKAKLTGGRPVSEAEFSMLLEGLEDSLSGSASSEDEDEGSDSDAIHNLLSKTRIQSRSPSPTERKRLTVTAVAWFHSPPCTQIGVYRAIFTQEAQQDAYLPELKAMQETIPQGRKWAMFMVAGGHFAGLIARVSRPSEAETDRQKGKQKKPVPEIEILNHKTFHRYTTRRKQGGSQSLNDQAKGNAKSAGALLRRYGEQALRDDIRNLIEEWAESISECERIWIRASGANRRIFIDYDRAIITKGDERLRTFPFPTRRPTQAELSRCLVELTKIKVTHFTEQELQAQDAAYLASLPKPKPQPQISKVAEKKQQQQKLTREEGLLRERWKRLLDMVRKGRLDSARTFWEREGAELGGVNAPIPAWIGEKTSTLLQFAASMGQAEVVTWLLDELYADPTILVSAPSGIETKSAVGSRPSTPDNVSQGLAEDNVVTDASFGKPASGMRTAYDLASTRAVRDAFRRSAAASPDAWDWFAAAHVPSALSAEMEAGRDEKKRKRREGLRERLRERVAAVASREQEEQTTTEEMFQPTLRTSASVPKTGPQRLGGAPMSSEGLAGLTPEMRARIERERRARAAEVRLRGGAPTTR